MDHSRESCYIVGTTGWQTHLLGRPLTASAVQADAKNHALVLEDCNLEASVNAIVNSTYGCAGMRCMALPVIVVQESIADEFVALLKEKAQGLKIGCAYHEETDLGPLVSARHKANVIGWINKGIEEAELVLDSVTRLLRLAAILSVRQSLTMSHRR